MTLLQDRANTSHFSRLFLLQEYNIYVKKKIIIQQFLLQVTI